MRKQPSSASARARIVVVAAVVVALAALAPPAPAATGQRLTPAAAFKRPRPTPTPTPSPSPTPTPQPTPSPTPTPQPFPGGTNDEAVAYQNNWSHDGAQPGDTMKPPLVRRWALDLGGDVSYPLIAGGRVFVSARYFDGSDRLYALDAVTGGVVWSQDLTVPGGFASGTQLAYDAGRVFASNANDARLWAFDATSGSLLWQSPVPPGRTITPTPPTAVAGIVYYQLGGVVYALRESDGSQVWTGMDNNPGDGPLAVDASRVYESYPCSSATAWSAGTGSVSWKVEMCTGGGAAGTPALHGGRLYVRGVTFMDTPTVYDAGSGAVLGQFSALTQPAFDGNTGFFLTGTPGGTISSVDLGSNTVKWTSTGDGGLRSNVLVANGFVYVASASGSVFALDESTGQQAWADNTDSPVQSGASMAVGEGMLAVPAGNLLVAYTSCASSCTPGPYSVVKPGPPSAFYFAEGSTAPGFNEQLELTSPHVSGTAKIDYFTSTGQASTTANVTAGQPLTLNVADTVGANQPVGVRVQLPGPGIAERRMNFQTGQWHGTSDKVGTPAPGNVWVFPEGSTQSAFSEYLSLLNPSSSPVTVDITYIADGANLSIPLPVKKLTLGPLSRTTVEVFSGDPASIVSGCTPSGPGANCGVGPGVGGVSAYVQGENGAQLVAERTLYVNGFDFGSGPVSDGDSTFGSTSNGVGVFFADGSTQPGFNEYITLLNFTDGPGWADLTYVTDDGLQVTRNLTLPARGRVRIPVTDPTNGVGPGHGGVSVAVNPAGGVVVERSEYLVHDFGSGVVAGAHNLVGTGTWGQLFGFASASTTPGDGEYLVIYNGGTGAIPVTVTLTYYAAGGPVKHTITVPAGRHTIAVADPVEGAGANLGQVGITVTSNASIVLEKSVYSANPASYGASSTTGASPTLVAFF